MPRSGVGEEPERGIDLCVVAGAPQETVFVGGLPFGAIEDIKSAYGSVVQILDPPRDGFNLTLRINLYKIPLNEEQRNGVLMKIASVREVVLGVALRFILKHLSSRTIAPDIDWLLSLVNRPNESYYVMPQGFEARKQLHCRNTRAEKVTLVFPMSFKDSIDTALATSFLQEFVEAR